MALLDTALRHVRDGRQDDYTASLLSYAEASIPLHSSIGRKNRV